MLATRGAGGLSVLGRGGPGCCNTLTVPHGLVPHRKCVLLGSPRVSRVPPFSDST